MSEETQNTQENIDGNEIPGKDNQHNQQAQGSGELAKATESIAKLESTLKKVNQRNRELEKVQQTLEKLGGLDGITQMVEAQKKAAETKLQEEGKFEELLASKVEEFSKRESDLLAQLEATQGRLKDMNRGQQFDKAFLANGVLDTHSDFLRHSLMQRTSVDDEGNVTVLDASGTQAFKVVDGKMLPKTINDLVLEAREDDKWGVAFKAQVKGGSGSLPGANSGGSMNRQDKAQELYNQLKAKAQKGEATPTDHENMTKLMLEAQMNGFALQT